MTKLLAAIAVITAIATPALAQSFDPDTGTGNVLQFSHTSGAHKADKMAARQNGLDAYATAIDGVAFGSNAPFATGGGSIGYNEMLRNY